MEAVLDWYVPRIPRLVAVWNPDKPVLIPIRHGKRIKAVSYDTGRLQDVMDEGDIEAFIQALLDDYASSNTFCEVQKLRNELFIGDVDYTDMNAVMGWYQKKLIADLVKKGFSRLEVYLDEFWVKDGERVDYSWENVACLHDAMNMMEEDDTRDFVHVILADYFSYTSGLCRMVTVEG